VSISKNLTIIGAGQGDDPASNTILDAEGAGRVLAIASAGADVELRDLRVTGGTASEGGGISNFGTLRLVGVTVMSNVTSTSGGGIRNLGFGTLTIGDGSRVEANETAGVGGGISSVGANATVTLEPGSRVTGNTADVRGGGIYNDSGTATLEAGSLVTGNTAGTGGGVHEASGTVDVADDTIVTSNTPNNCRPVGAVPNCID
jgi:hypothetical protein